MRRERAQPRSTQRVSTHVADGFPHARDGVAGRAHAISPHRDKTTV